METRTNLNNNNKKYFKCLVVGPAFNIQINQKTTGNARAAFLMRALDPNYNPDGYCPYAASNPHILFEFPERKAALALWDGFNFESNLNSQYPRFLELECVQTNLLLFIFSTKNRTSFEELIKFNEYMKSFKYMPKNVKSILVSITDDCIDNLTGNLLTQRVVTDIEVDNLKKAIDAVDYIECSVSKPEEITKVLSLAISYFAKDKREHLPPFFQKLPLNYETTSFINSAIEIAKAKSPRSKPNPLQNLPTEVVLDIMNQVGADLGTDMKTLTNINRFFLRKIATNGNLKEFNYEEEKPTKRSCSIM